ncbi:SGNH/GDSL hydrolase family protein [Nocardioides montaniterrae]
MSRSRILIGAVVVLAMLGIAAPIWAHARHGNACGTYRAAEHSRAALVTGSGRKVLVIGDSYAAGWLASPAQSWPTRLEGRVAVDGFPGSGFSTQAGVCRGVDFATRAGRDLRREGGHALVVVQGGLNDHDVSDTAVEAGFGRLLAATKGHELVVVGPPPAPSRAASAARVDVLLERLCAAAGVPYVSTIGLHLPYLPDRLHLTPDGHRMFGDAVALALA